MIVIERPGVIDAFGAASNWSNGGHIQVFGVIVVLFLLQFIVGAVIQAIANDMADRSWATPWRTWSCVYSSRR